MLDILDRFFTLVFKYEVLFMPDSIEHGTRNENATGIGQAFQARCHVNPVAVDFTPIDDDFTQVYADAKQYALVLGQMRIDLGNI